MKVTQSNRERQDGGIFFFLNYTMYMALYRNIRARDLLEVFLVAAVTSLLLVRLYLHLSGYPQLGGGNFHIAHMLWGGFLMLIAVVVSLSFLGLQARLLTALIGGLGFGVFIDEIGKFITHDNNYFYRPAVGIIYAVFVVLYLTFSFITRNSKLNSREYQLNALSDMEEAISHELDEAEKERARLVLNRAAQDDLLTIALQRLFDEIETVPQSPRSRVALLRSHVDGMYANFWSRRSSSYVVRTFFMVEVGVIFLGVLTSFITNIDDLIELVTGRLNDGTWLLMGELVAALIASLLALGGAFKLNSSRLEAFELFRTATLVNLFLTEFFRFSRVEFAALPSFTLNLALIMVISYAIGQERRLLLQVKTPVKQGK